MAPPPWRSTDEVPTKSRPPTLMLWPSFSSILFLRPSRVALVISALLLHPFGSAHALPVPDSIMVREGAMTIWDFESSSDGWGEPNRITGLAASHGCLRKVSVAAAPEVEFETQDDLSRLILSRTPTTASPFSTCLLAHARTFPSSTQVSCFLTERRSNASIPQT